MTQRKITLEELSKARQMRKTGLSYGQIVRMLHIQMLPTSLARAIQNPLYGTQESPGRFKLTSRDVATIRLKFKNLSSVRRSRERLEARKRFAKAFGVTHEHIRNILVRKTWK